MLTLLWGPAKDATVPNIVKDPEQLASANSFGLVAAFGTFPLGAVMFAALAGIAHWLGGFHALGPLGVKQESLAIWVDGVHVPRLGAPDLAAAARRRRARDADSVFRPRRPGATSRTASGSFARIRSCAA